MPVLRTLLDAETSHKLALRVLGSGLAPRDTQKDDERLRTSLWGEELSNPLGMAAGFDKDGEATDGLFNLGFSWVEIGSVTPRPQVSILSLKPYEAAFDAVALLMPYHEMLD
ncbi:hypothetical protein EVJ58_g9322 [Rhodofomes roseus]|uniref:Dihydroorotate dehydrogenase catalytic domain-containing protein n=1 Tax=Rhodofomes roseus TaxID=34475 RepID=A0A4Y9XYL7_9APHY|nr:hypothetical protein EVJ58_g9322 [Rhodofomes roseus]